MRRPRCVFPEAVSLPSAAGAGRPVCRPMERMPSGEGKKKGQCRAVQVSPREKPVCSGCKIPSLGACGDFLPQAGILSSLLCVFTAFLKPSADEPDILAGRINFSLRGRLRRGDAKRHMLKKKKNFFNETRCNNGKIWLVFM